MKWKRCSVPDNVLRYSVWERSTRLNSSVLSAFCVSPLPFFQVAAFLYLPARQPQAVSFENLSVGPQEPFLSRRHSAFVHQRTHSKGSCQKTLTLVLLQKCTLCSLYIVLLPTCCWYYGLSQGACRALYGSQTVKCDAVTQYRAFEGTGADSMH